MFPCSARALSLAMLTLPENVEIKNSESACERTDFVPSESKIKMFLKGCTVEVSKKTYVVNPLTVA